MENRTKHWILGKSLKKEFDNLHFLYKALVNNVKKHRNWKTQDNGSDTLSAKDSILLTNSPSDLAKGFEGEILFANNSEPISKTNSKIVRLGSFFPDEYDYPQDIPLITLRPDISLLDNLTSTHDIHSILLLREPSENESNRNILNALESLPESSSILLDLSVSAPKRGFAAGVPALSGS